MSEKTCKHCGSPIPAKSKKCHGCGHYINGSHNDVIIIGIITMFITMYMLIATQAPSNPNYFKLSSNSGFLSEVTNLLPSSNGDANDIKKLTQETYKALGYSKEDIKKLDKLTSDSYEAMGYSKEDIEALENINPEELMDSFFGGFTEALSDIGEPSTNSDSNKFKEYFYNMYNADLYDDSYDGKMQQAFAEDIYTNCNFSKNYIKEINSKSDNEIYQEVLRQVTFYNNFYFPITNLGKIKYFELWQMSDKDFQEIKNEVKSISSEEKKLQRDGVEEFNKYIIDTYNLTSDEIKLLDKLTKGLYKDLGI